MPRCTYLPGTCLLVALLSVPVMSLAEKPQLDEFRPLFNGRDLEGWVLTNTPPATWKVEDGLLVCSGRPIGEIRTERMYQNFILELEWRHMKPKGNAGVFIWADDITARGVPFHRGIEVQVLENAYGNTRSHTTHGDIFPIHGATMSPVNGRGGSRAFPTEERSKPSPEWNHYRITCQDGAISLAVNGKVVTQGKDASPRMGYICLESEGGVVHYRNVQIKELPDTPVAEEHVATRSRGYRSLYTGLDLSGWNVSEEGARHWQVNDWVLTYDGQADPREATLATRESFGDYGFLLDVKLKADSTSLQISLRPGDDGGLSVAMDDPQLAAALQKPGQWNRVEGTVREHRLNLTLNGRPVITNQPLPAGSAALTLVPAGPLDLANLFVRPLE